MTILTELHQDHINLDKLLVLLRSKVGQLRAGHHPNFNLIGDVVSYIAGYADGFHHPREDKIYAYFKGRDTELDPLLENCEKEHNDLKQSSSQLQDAIDGILHDAVIPMNEFADLLDDYVSRQTLHLNLEEGDIFPKLEAIAEEKDWSYLAQQLPKPDDPLFGEKQAVEFTDLYKELIIDMNAA
ncbi:hemerythrin domain-containing protein [Neptuniibacter sp.]|uniref:hemerythrin domain-containing protein n=1 Tax=Neptuniibacter sp. TaxID=1962643 RepID=UPI003B5BE835